MNLINRLILEDYRKQRDDYVKLGDIVHSVLKEICDEVGIKPLGIEHRVKAEKSLAGKLEKNSGWYSSFEDLTDILGARVICFFADDIDKIGKLVEQRFAIDWENSSDKRALIKADSFGYLSLHYICCLPIDSEYPNEVCGKKFEIQIRTALQHAWAAINHDLGYKSEFGVPRIVTREFSRIAGLLEIADDEFVRVRDHMRGYTENIRQKIIENKADDVNIDSISLNEYVRRNTKMQEFLAAIGEMANAEIREIDAEGYIAQLKFLGKEILGDVQTMMEENSGLAFKLAEKGLANADLDILSSTVGLRFLCRAELLNKAYSEEMITEFLKLSLGTDEKANRQAKHLVRIYQRIKEEEMYKRALDFAAEKHRGQHRVGGAEYITHPIAVSEIVKENGGDINYRITALFHDLLEDTDATDDEILALSNPEVLKAVKLLTKQKGYVMDEYVANIRKNNMAFAVKGADRLHNLRCAVLCDDDFKRRYIFETVDYYLDFMPEIPKAVKNLAQSLSRPISELPFLYEPIETWKIKNN